MTVEEGLFGEDPVAMVCPKCVNRIETSLEEVKSVWAYVACTGACVCCCLIPVCWWTCCVPFCMKRFRDVEHSCPRCHTVIGKHKRIQLMVGQDS